MVKKSGVDGLFPVIPITPVMVKIVGEICERVGHLDEIVNRRADLRLRRSCQVQSVQASLEIEGNTLTLEQVTAVLEGKRVLGSRREIQEIRNAIKAYEQMNSWNPGSIKDLLEAHAVLMLGLVDKPGHFRAGAVGIKRGGELLHAAPPARLVPELIKKLFAYLENMNEHPLLKSCIFHYEFEFIHPFSDGNGRLGRLWQTLLLSRWKDFFAGVPLGTMVRDRQAEYYAALNESNRAGHAGPFVNFMLVAIRDTLNSLQTPPVTTSVTPPVKKLLELLSEHGEMSNQDILIAFGLKDRRRLREAYIAPALQAGLIEYTLPDKPNSRYQKYRLIRIGRELLI